MGLINTIKGWFHKEEPKEEVKPSEEPINQSEPIPAQSQETGEKCDHCGMAIHGDQKKVHKYGKVFHVKPCWRKLQSGAWNEVAC